MHSRPSDRIVKSINKVDRKTLFRRRAIVNKKITNYILTNAQGMQVTVCNYGARILSIKVPNKTNQIIETTLNHQTDHDVINDVFYMGATCGRISNRLNGAQFNVGNKTIKLQPNEGKNLLHGGKSSFSHRYWHLEHLQQNKDDAQLIFSLLSEDGDQGFPGNLTVKVCYSLTTNNELRIDYQAKSDALCPINMCNHAYFNLGSKNIDELLLNVSAKRYLPVDEQNIPTGEISSLTAALDLNNTKPLHTKLSLIDLDHCYVLEKNKEFAAVLRNEQQGVLLAIATDQVAMQVYSGNFLPIKHSAIALEAQGLVDAPNQAGFACDWVGPDNDYQKFVTYKFETC